MRAGMERDFTESQAAVEAQRKTGGGERRAGRRSAPRGLWRGSREGHGMRRGLGHLPGKAVG